MSAPQQWQIDPEHLAAALVTGATPEQLAEMFELDLAEARQIKAYADQFKAAVQRLSRGESAQ